MSDVDVSEKRQFLIRQATAAEVMLDVPEITFRKWQNVLKNPFGSEMDYIRQRAFFSPPWSDKIEGHPRCFYGHGYYNDVFSDRRVQLSVFFARGTERYHDLGAICTFSSGLMNSLCSYGNLYRRFWVITPNQGVMPLDIQPLEIRNSHIIGNFLGVNGNVTEGQPEVTAIDQVDEKTYFSMLTLGFYCGHCNELQASYSQVKPDSIVVIATAAVGCSSDNNISYWTKLNLTVVKPADDAE